MMSVVLLFVFLVAVLFAISVATRKTKGRRTASFEVPRANTPFMTEREMAMYNRLYSTLPGYPILAQVAFSALLTAKNRPTRSTFDRKRADFVVLSKSLEVLLVIELDDSSHKGRDRQDAAREKLLTDAGYCVVRFRSIPNVEDLRKLFVEAVSHRETTSVGLPPVKLVSADGW